MVRSENTIQVFLGRFGRIETTPVAGTPETPTYDKPTGERNYNVFMRIDLDKLKPLIAKAAAKGSTGLVNGGIAVFIDTDSMEYTPIR